MPPINLNNKSNSRGSGFDLFENGVAPDADLAGYPATLVQIYDFLYMKMHFFVLISYFLISEKVYKNDYSLILRLANTLFAGYQVNETNIRQMKPYNWQIKQDIGQ